MFNITIIIFTFLRLSPYVNDLLTIIEQTQIMLPV